MRQLRCPAATRSCARRCTPVTRAPSGACAAAMARSASSERLQALRPPRRAKLLIGYSDATTAAPAPESVLGLALAAWSAAGSARQRRTARRGAPRTGRGAVRRLQPHTTFANLVPLNRRGPAPAAHRQSPHRRQPHGAAEYAGHRAAAPSRGDSVPGGYRRARLSHRPHARAAAPGRRAAQSQGHRARHLPGRRRSRWQQPRGRRCWSASRRPCRFRCWRESMQVTGPTSVRCFCTPAPSCNADRMRSSAYTRPASRADESPDPSARRALLRAARGAHDRWLSSAPWRPSGRASVSTTAPDPCDLDAVFGRAARRGSWRSASATAPT